MAHLPPVAPRADVSTLGAALRGDMAEVRGEMAELRREMAMLRAHVDGLVPRIVAANLASLLGVAGVVIGAATLLR